MNKRVLRLLLPVVCLFLVAETPQADAQSPQPTGPQAAAIFTILIGVPVAIGFGVYYAVRAPRHIQGCIAEDGGTLQLVDGRGKVYLLSGETADIKPNQRLSLSGKAGKDAMKRRTFSVMKLSESHGACTPAVSRLR